MERQWFPQRYAQDAVTALIKNFIFNIEINISRSTIEAEVRAHKEYPFLSYGAIIEILSKWGIKAVSYTWNVERLQEIPPYSILYIQETDENRPTGFFIMLYQTDRNMIEYLHTRKGWVLESVEEFTRKWTGAALSLLAVNNPEGEADFERKEQAYEQQLKQNPASKDVRIMENFLSPDECEYIIRLANPLFRPSQVMTDADLSSYGRTSHSAELIFPDDEVLNTIRRRAAGLINMPESHFEFFQCVTYSEKQEYQRHYDTFDVSTEPGRKMVEQTGQRKYTLLVYLNDDFRGGCTHFPNLDIMVEPKKGRLLVFNNLDENGNVLKASFHAGLPVTIGQKYAVNIWVRNKPFYRDL